MTKKEVIKKLRENKKEIKKFGVKSIGIFGSVSRDEAREKSDIDLVVDFASGMKTFDNYIELKFFLEDLLNCKIDLVLINSIKADLKPHILKEIEYV